MHIVLKGVTAKISNLDSENALLRKKVETSSKTSAEAKADLVRNLGETRNDLGMKVRECDAHRAKVGEL